MRGRIITAVAIVGALMLAACGGGGDEPDADAATTPPTVTAAVATQAPAETDPPDTTPATDPPTTAPATTVADGTVPTASEPVVAGWSSFQLADCQCSDGSDATFYERIADPTKVVLFFEGGGACFNAATCDPNGQPTYTVNQGGMTAESLDERGGYFDFTNPENPLADYSWIYVPYCTGDVHLGDATTNYGPGEGGEDVVIEHDGNPNAVKALDYLAATFPDLTKLVVTGQSAGSIPTPQFAGRATDLFPDADIVTFGDSSGAYPDVDAVSGVIATSWGAMNGVPDWPETQNIGINDWSFPEQYIVSGAHAPNVRFGRFDFAFDEVQAFFGSLAGVPGDELVTLIDGSEADIEATGVPIASYVAPGTLHTIASEPEFYTLEVNGVRLIDWFTQLINGETPPDDVHCDTCT